MNKRLFPRFPCDLKIVYEFVNWDAAEPLFPSAGSPELQVIDLSLSGAGLEKLPHIDANLKKKLLSGDKKLDIALYGPGSPARIPLFGRMIWLGDGATRGGIMFIGITDFDFPRLRALLESISGGQSVTG